MIARMFFALTHFIISLLPASQSGPCVRARLFLHIFVCISVVYSPISVSRFFGESNGADDIETAPETTYCKFCVTNVWEIAY